jgi:surface antigen
VKAYRVLLLAAAALSGAAQLGVAAAPVADPLADPLAGVAGLNAEDRALMARAAERVVMAQVPPGAKASWYNKHANNGGLVTLLRNGRCREARYDITLAARNSTQSYLVTWCQQPDGSWAPKR